MAIFSEPTSTDAMGRPALTSYRLPLLVRALFSLGCLGLIVLGQYARWATHGELRLGLVVIGLLLYLRPKLATLALVVVATVISRWAFGGSWSDISLGSLIAIVEASALAWVLHFVQRTPSGTDPRRRYWRLFAVLFALGLTGAILQASALSLVGTSRIDQVANTWSGRVLQAGLPLLVAAFAAAFLASMDWRPVAQRRSLNGLAPSLLVAAMAIASVQATVNYLDLSAARTLNLNAQTAASTLQGVIGDTLNSFSARANTAPRTPWTSTSTFGHSMEPFLYGNQSISAVAYIPTAPVNGREGFAVDLQGGAPSLLDTLGGGASDALARAMVVQRSSQLLLGVRRVPGAAITNEWALVYATAQAGATRPSGVLSVAISLPQALSEAVAGLGVELPHVNYRLDLVSAHASVAVASLGAKDETRAASGRHGTSTLVYGDKSFVLTTTAEPGFGISLGAESLILGGEGLTALLFILLLLQAAASRERGERSVRERELLLTSAITASPGLLAIVDDATRVVFSNATDLATGEEAPRLLRDVMPFKAPTDVLATVESLAGNATRGEHGTLQVVDAESAETPHYSEVSATPVDAQLDGSALAMVSVSDITELRTRDIRKAQFDRLESLSAMARGLAHDFNNLLFIITGYLNQVLESEEVLDHPRIQSAARHAAEAAHRGSEISTALLTVAGGQRLKESQVTAADILRRVEPLARQALGDSRTLVVDLPGEELRVGVDVGLMSSALLNLVINARDATAEGATVRISAHGQGPDDLPSPLRPGHYVVFSVADDGEGVPPDIASRIFDPYFTTKAPGRGNGLGLATVYSFARQSGGLATLENRPGEGATIKVYLPQRSAHQSNERARGDVPVPRRVLVVDDEAALGELVTSWLIDADLEVHFVQSPEAALFDVEAFAPDTVLTDVRLGADVDGLELAARLTFVRPEVNVVFMTGYSEKMNLLLDRGMTVLAKPFTREDLLTTLSVTESAAPRSED